MSENTVEASGRDKIMKFLAGLDKGPHSEFDSKGIGMAFLVARHLKIAAGLGPLTDSEKSLQNGVNDILKGDVGLTDDEIAEQMKVMEMVATMPVVHVFMGSIEDLLAHLPSR